MIVPTLRVGMQPGTLRVPSKAERGASVEAFPRRAWERSVSQFPFPQRLTTAARSLQQNGLTWLLG
ncbi:hypothetical protein PS880_02446 [Pseudomonas fluorescens]|uniref:Uncharacterized protein n=1 Tax=Pseudomonas fluorescens TaxID=294 RepID=A0A5E7KD78_PSEFL|nr:hypothetical protein PS880_02446 [Pseudomonas fluorescens]